MAKLLHNRLFIHVIYNDHGDGPLLLHQPQPELFFRRLEQRNTIGIGRVNEPSGGLLRIRARLRLQLGFGRPNMLVFITVIDERKAPTIWFALSPDNFWSVIRRAVSLRRNTRGDSTQPEARRNLRHRRAGPATSGDDGARIFYSAAPAHSAPRDAIKAPRSLFFRKRRFFPATASPRRRKLWPQLIPGSRASLQYGARFQTSSRNPGLKYPMISPAGAYRYFFPTPLKYP